MNNSGINSKLIRVFVMQMLFISIITALGVLAAALIVEKVMIHAALEREAEHFWQQLEKHQAHPVPNTDNLEGHIAPVDDLSRIPEELRASPLGFSFATIPHRGKHIVYVEDKQAQRLFLIFDAGNVGKLSFWFGVVPLSLVLMVMYISAWIAYRASQRTLSPIISLARTMSNFDLNRHDLNSLKLDDYTAHSNDDEVYILAESLKAFTNRLKRQLQREQEFTRDVSHELRTPLAVIRGSLQIIEKHPLTPAQQRAVKRMDTTSRDMLSLIETLLLLARESDEAEKKHEDVVINDLAKLLIEQVETTHNKDHHVTIGIEDNRLLTIKAPRQAIGVVLSNLLRNACNYTRDGSVLVSIDDNSVTIKDTGGGIAANDLERVQQPFQRSSEQTEGHGLGLDIVRRLCERYDWELDINSIPDQGTAVSVRF